MGCQISAPALFSIFTEETHYRMKKWFKITYAGTVNPFRSTPYYVKISVLISPLFLMRKD
jgi:hypothetical protein